MHPHTKQQLKKLEELSEECYKINDILIPDCVNDFLIQALKSQAQMIRDEIYESIGEQIIIHKELSGQILLKMGEENHHLEYIRLLCLLHKKMEAKLDKLINSFK